MRAGEFSATPFFTAISEGANALIIGKPGTGKSHVAKAVAYASEGGCQQPMRQC